MVNSEVTDMLFFTQNFEKCSRCGHVTSRRVDVQDAMENRGGRRWELWRCDCCEHERTVPVLLPAHRESRTVIC
ncbi:MAG TPA: hypothetical protein VGZ27_06450 [Vicinamibacterales bacterium]|jgi:hypothetical protein|nr:hypothetical protein [Vicinamibacterales bacterium]